MSASNEAMLASESMVMSTLNSSSTATSSASGETATDAGTDSPLSTVEIAVHFARGCSQLASTSAVGVPVTPARAVGVPTGGGAVPPVTVTSFRWLPSR